MFLLAWVQLYMLGPELTKLPMLLMHYQEHCTDDGPLSFSAFLDLHYSERGHDKADHKGHENLPFHHHHGCVVDHCSLKVYTSDPAPAVSFPALVAKSYMGLLVDDAELSGHPRIVLQPPKSLALS